MSEVNNHVNIDDRRRKILSYTLKMYKEIERIERLLKESNHEYQSYLLAIPKSVRVGYELEYRYFHYEHLKRMIREIVHDFVPEDLKQQYFAKIPESPLDFIIQNLYIKSKTISKEDRFDPDYVTVQNS